MIVYDNDDEDDEEDDHDYDEVKVMSFKCWKRVKCSKEREWITFKLRELEIKRCND